MVEWDAASWFTRGRFICLLEVFILKKGNEKNGHRQAKIKKDEHALTKCKQNNNNNNNNNNKTQAKATAARV